MDALSTADTLHRLAKRALDTGQAHTIEEAYAALHEYRISILLDDDAADDRDHQNALLSSIALGRRVFLGGVGVSGKLDVPLRSPLPLGDTLAQAVIALGGTIAPAPARGAPLVHIGRVPGKRASGFCVRPVFGGWRGGIVPSGADGISEASGPAMALTPMLAAALAINECFLHLSGEMASAGKRSVGLNLWDLAEPNWLDAETADPELRYLPEKLWLIGLGHLGQAYLFGLGTLPYANPSSVKLILQDDDVITVSTESTSILSDAAMIGLKKTRVMAAWAETRGFKAIITERLFDVNTRRRADEPAVALCGLDNGAGRQALDAAGFDFVAEAGLGRGPGDFRTMLIHTLPGSITSKKMWQSADEVVAATKDMPAYQNMLKAGSLDDCGVTLLAGKAVGAPFVGAAAATIVLAEVLRLLHGGAINRLVDLNLVSPEHRVTVLQKSDFSTLNPGFALLGQE